jgi:hypothetical protein
VSKAKIHYVIGPVGEPDAEGEYSGDQFTDHTADFLWKGENEDGEEVILVENSSQYPGVIHSVWRGNVMSVERVEDSSE